MVVGGGGVLSTHPHISSLKLLKKFCVDCVHQDLSCNFNVCSSQSNIIPPLCGTEIKVYKFPKNKSPYMKK
jgi:hypothetical protein